MAAPATCRAVDQHGEQTYQKELGVKTIRTAFTTGHQSRNSGAKDVHKGPGSFVKVVFLRFHIIIFIIA